jgi:hypothetical protein
MLELGGIGFIFVGSYVIQKEQMQIWVLYVGYVGIGLYFWNWW